MHPLPPPNRGQSSNANEARDHPRSENRPPPTPLTSGATASGPAQGSTAPRANTDGKKKRKHRGGKKRRNRRPSFAAQSDASAMQSMGEGMPDDPLIQVPEDEHVGGTFYRRGTNLSDESFDSEALLDHRDQPVLRTRRESRAQNVFGPSHRSGMMGQSFHRQDSYNRRSQRTKQSHKSSGDDSDGQENANDKTPLIASSSGHKSKSPLEIGYGLFKKGSRTSSLSSKSKQRRKPTATTSSFPTFDQDYDVNNPPSMPGSPNMAAQYGGLSGNFLSRSPDMRRSMAESNDALIDIDDDDVALERDANSAPPSPRLRPDGLRRHGNTQVSAEGDVCFPVDEVSEMAEDEDYERSRSMGPYQNTPRRRNRRRDWPQLWVLDEWSREEKEERAAGDRRAKKISEPVFVEGRLRPSKNAWHKLEEDVPYRYTYFNEEFETTIHAQTISELVQPGGSFRELFIPDPPELDESSESEAEEAADTDLKRETSGVLSPKSAHVNGGGSASASRANSLLGEVVKNRSAEASGGASDRNSGNATPQQPQAQAQHGQDQLQPPKAKKYGPRPTFWLDVMCPTDQEMRVLCKTFGIHALTSEDIMMQEAREKVELFRNYYFINYRTFEQDTNSEDYLDPINMYVCVFRHGIITFHFSQIPHPANVRRRIRQLTDYLILSSDWISYAIIDDITDVYQPLITNIEQEVDDIDELILRAFQDTDEFHPADEKNSDSGDQGPTGIDMLRRIGETRKKVMSLYRLLGTKADVIKGFAKRCNEHWEVAPKSEIGLYLGDIQDHILTMTSNLSHYETLLSRAHSNFLAQVNIRMNERQEKTSDVLGKLTVVGTIVLPMNIICGMWGMNVKVPGQEIDNLYWFWGITAGLFTFAVACFFWAKRVYGIV